MSRADQATERTLRIEGTSRHVTLMRQVGEHLQYMCKRSIAAVNVKSVRKRKAEQRVRQLRVVVEGGEEEKQTYLAGKTIAPTDTWVRPSMGQQKHRCWL